MTSVAVVSPSFYPMIGGIESYIQGMGKELLKLGFKIDVYTPNRVLGKACGPEEELIDGILVHRIDVPLELSYRVKLWPGLTGFLQRGRHGLIHVYSHDSYTFFALTAARRTGVPLAITTYGPFDTHSDHGLLRGGAFRLYDSVVTPQLMGRSAAVFVRYPDLTMWVQSLGVDPERIHLEPSGIPKEDLERCGSSVLRHSLGGGPIVLYLGRISPQKGVVYAVESMGAVTKRFPEAKLVLIGPDYLGYSKVLRARARELGVSEAVVFLDPMKDERLQLDAISSCDAFVMPSSFEGFSQAVMKAMAQGKPVVVTNVGGLPYEVDYGKCGVLCPYGDSKSLAESLIAVLSQEDLARGIAENAMTRARSFTFDVLAARLAEQYGQLAG